MLLAAGLVVSCGQKNKAPDEDALPERGRVNFPDGFFDGPPPPPPPPPEVRSVPILQPADEQATEARRLALERERAEAEARRRREDLEQQARLRQAERELALAKEEAERLRRDQERQDMLAETLGFYRSVTANKARRAPPVDALPAPAVPAHKNYTPLDIDADVSGFPVSRERMLMAGTNIPGVLGNTLNSQLPGLVRVYVSRDVYAADGDLVVFPKGTEVLCTYESLAKQGSTRLPVTCNRATRPDGAGVVISAAIGSDQSGRLGFVGEVDNRTWERYGDAATVAGITFLGAYAAAQLKDGQVSQGALGATQALTDASGRIIRDNLQLAPIVTVAAGSRVLVTLGTDLWLREPGATDPPSPNDPTKGQNAANKPPKGKKS